jgi:hypothetical protein
MSAETAGERAYRQLLKAVRDADVGSVTAKTEAEHIWPTRPRWGFSQHGPSEFQCPSPGLGLAA